MRRSNKNEIEKAIIEYVLENGISSFNFTKLSQEINVSKRMILHYYETKEIMLMEISNKIFSEYVKALDSFGQVMKFEQVFELLKTVITTSSINSQIGFWLDLINLKENPFYLQLANQAINHIRLFFDSILDKNEKNREDKINILIITTEGIAVLSKIQKNEEIQNYLNSAHKIFTN